MIRVAVTALLFVTTSAHAEDLLGIPQNCEAPLAHDLEMRNIPYLLDLGPNAARITQIETIGGPDAYQYALNLYRIDCAVTVHWSNDTIDRAFLFSVWENRYGEVEGSYGPQIRR